VRGMFAEDASDAIEKAIDTAYGGGAASLKIIHGHGSGKLKKHIREILPLLSKRYGFDFISGGDEDGGDAVTVLKFSK
jgi:DNA mismatch repair protein MutS2